MEYGEFVHDSGGNEIEAAFHAEAKRSAPSATVSF
jgi:hypothetical protein